MTETWKVYRALDLISRIKKEETHEKYIDRHNAFDIAIESMEKQIPKKPTDVDEDTNTFVCPSCGHTLIALDDMTVHQHCLICGQKLDWSEEDE